jgi:hypothetical protein
VLDAILASEGRVLSTAEVTGQVAEFLPPGPGLAGWLATTPSAALDDCALAGVAASWRRLASWANAGELATIGQIAARAAARDKDIGVEADGRPARIGADATGEVCLALMMSQCGASWWADLAVTLNWRLARTGAALRDGIIDLSRARLIAEVTSVLSEDAARAVEEKVLSRAGDQTLGQLRAVLRRAVIIADPDGAERRREEAERRAKVCLYPDEEGTATLAGQSLPGIRAAAAMARITAMARAMKASGARGGIDLLRAQVFVGLLLGTLPYIPPAPDGPVDEPPDDGSGDDPAGPGQGDVRPDPARGGSCPDSSAPRRGRPASTGPGAATPSGRGGSVGVRPQPDQSSDGSDPPGPEPPGSSGPPDPEPPTDSDPPGSQPPAGPDPPGPEAAGPEAAGPEAAGPEAAGPEAAGPGPPTGPDRPRPDDGCPWPVPGTHDDPYASAGDDDPGSQDASLGAGPSSGWVLSRDIDDDDDGPGPPGWPIPPWPTVPASLPLGFGSAGVTALGTPVLWPASPDAPALGAAVGDASGRSTADRTVSFTPVRGMLDITVPFTALAGLSAEPGWVSRLGPVSAPEARNLAALAASDPAVRWRIILTSASGQAIGVARVPGIRVRGARNRRAGVGQVTGPAKAPLVGRVTITVPECILSPSSPGQFDNLTPSGGPAGNLAAILDAALDVAAAAAAQATRNQAADASSGGCAHQFAASGYRPPPGLREYIAARDLTCRFITCRQPAWRSDLDHTIPWEKGGRTCTCNLGGLCRFHHRLKQHLGWTLTQSAPGIFTWTTPTGRSYAATPDVHP